ncbi:MAG: hypothetical protein MJZ26_09895 [Fibrobacter sp.]|nr:hypothetical protein [Fibrobacter sp.]
MNKNSLAHFAALVTAALVAACSSDNSVSLEDADLVVSDYGQVKMGACLAGLGDEIVLYKTVSFDTTAPAVIYPNNGSYEIMLPAVMDYCAVYAPVITKMAGDTLVISYDFSKDFAATNCSCVSDHYFDVDERFIGAKFAKFENQVFEVRFIENPKVLDTISDETVAEERQPMQTFPENVISVNVITVDLVDTAETYLYFDVRPSVTGPTPDFSDLVEIKEPLTYADTVELNGLVWTNFNLDVQVSLTDSAHLKRWCYNDDSTYCEKYGRLYTLEEALQVCRNGWHLPTSDEWKESVGYGYDAYVKFSAKGWGREYWTSTRNVLNNDCATSVEFGDSSAGVAYVCEDDENRRLSVRCVKDYE